MNHNEFYAQSNEIARKRLASGWRPDYHDKGERGIDSYMTRVALNQDQSKYVLECWAEDTNGWVFIRSEGLE